SYHCTKKMMEFHDGWQHDQRKIVLCQEALNRSKEEVGFLRSSVNHLSVDAKKSAEAYMRLIAKKSRMATELQERQHRVTHLEGKVYSLEDELTRLGDEGLDVIKRLS
ncbi:hypothetical protein U1Q18_048681, partial [Sarracenia purpurea var. burkii]